MIQNAEDSPPVEILLVEDNPGDHRLTKEALHEGKVYNNLHWAQDGVEAIDFLKRRGKHKDAPRPGIVLLDLNMPRKDGREALREIKEDPELRTIPIVVLTTSREEEDILRTYGLGASSYIQKPVGFDSLVRIVEALGNYWFQVVELPREGSGR